MNLRRSSRSENKAKLTLTIPITNYGSVKRRLNFTGDTISHAKKLARVDLPVMPAQMGEIPEQSTRKYRSKATPASIPCQMGEFDVPEQSMPILRPMATVAPMMPSTSASVSSPSAYKIPEKSTHSSNATQLSPRKFAGDTPKMSLYERIMEKQRRHDEKLAPERQNVIKRRKYLELLRDDVFYAIWSIFRARPKTTALKLTEVVFCVCRSIKTLTGSECTDIIDILCEMVPRYFDVFTAGAHSCKYMRINMQGSNTKYSEILQIIKAEYNNLVNAF